MTLLTLSALASSLLPSTQEWKSYSVDQRVEYLSEGGEIHVLPLSREIE